MKHIYVIAARHLHDYVVEIEFSDHKKRVIDFKPQIDKIQVHEYKKYRDLKHFKSFAIENGHLVWGKGWDLIFPNDQLYDGKIL